MTLPPLDNLVKIGQMKVEPRSESEVRQLLAMARMRLVAASLASRSLEVNEDVSPGQGAPGAGCVARGGRSSGATASAVASSAAAVKR
jgi:hypothetical protein